MSKSQEQIEQELVHRFVSNLEYLKEKHSDLFQKVELLSTALNEGLYEEKYALEYIQEKNDFDILDIDNKLYLYSKSFMNFNKEEVKTINLSKSKTFTNLNNKLYTERENSNILPETKYKLLEELITRDTASLKSTLLDINTSDNYKYVDKFMFLGTLLGSHIEASVKKVSPKLVFIIEENLEIFRLSLFITDYKKISEKTHILFSIMDERNLFMQKLNLFVSEYFQFSNYNIKYSKMPNFNDDLLNLILTKLHLENPFIFDYTKVLHDTTYFISKHINKYKIMTLKKDKNKISSFFKDKPILFIGAGPSFSKNLDWINKNQDGFIIVAMGAVYKKLFESGINVDVVTTADSQYEILDRTHFNKDDVKLLKNTIVIASIGTPTKILNRFNQDNLFLFETYQSLKSTTNCYNGASIGEVTLNILLDLKVKSIYMIGIDLAIDEKSGMTHYEGYENAPEKLEKDIELNSALKGKQKKLREEFLEVKGVYKDKVVTTRVFALSLAKYEEIINEFKEEQAIYNLSKEAAFIQGVDFFDKEKFSPNVVMNKNIGEVLSFYSEFGLTEAEESSVNNRIQNNEILLSFVKDSLKNNKIKTLPQFILYIDELFKNILKTEDYLCSNLLANYFKVSLPYIYESLNDEKVKPKIIAKKIERVHSLVLKQVENLIEIYIDYLKLVIKKTKP